MYKVILALIISINAHAGVGGISGAMILFQDDSTFVNAYFDRSICHDGFEYKAMINECTKYRNSRDDRTCERWSKKPAFQPIESTRMRCKSFAGSDDDCREYEEVKFIQKPVRQVLIKDESGNILKKRKLTIPECK
ncbi:MAG: hypothetical protein EP319_13495 [Deltaproteobacteria bacterium]|nr:MAG: hypothetical protein EP319_13495 [Deltaproteobacteria bacterium]